MNAKTRAYIEVHIAVFLFGFTAILGKLIDLSAIVLVWWRVLITSISLLFLIRSVRVFREIPRRLVFQYMGIGVLVALHWLAFYGSIKESNSSIALICMATTSFFTAFLEPMLLRQRIQVLEIGLGLLILPGMALIVNTLDFSMILGVVLGLIAAFLAALFATLNKKLISRAEPTHITFIELSSVWLFLSLLMPVYLSREPGARFWPNPADWMYLLVLALACTTLAYVLSLRALKHLSAFASNLIINLEPVYGILLAWVLLREDKELAPGFYWGVGVILLAVMGYPAFKRWGGL